MSYFYISNPYNGTEAEKNHRAEVAARSCALLLKRGVHAWSPIVHNHSMLKTNNIFTLEERRTVVLNFDFTLLRASSGMIVLEIDGWDRSFGVNAEIELCRKLDIPIKYLNPSDLDTALPTDEILRDSPLKLTTEVLL